MGKKAYAMLMKLLVPDPAKYTPYFVFWYNRIYSYNYCISLYRRLGADNTVDLILDEPFFEKLDVAAVRDGSYDPIYSPPMKKEGKHKGSDPVIASIPFDGDQTIFAGF